MTSFGKYFFVPLIWPHFYTLRLKKRAVLRLEFHIIKRRKFSWHALNLRCCSQISSAIKILKILGIEQFLK